MRMMWTLSNSLKFEARPTRARVMWIKLAISSLLGWMILGCLLTDSAAKGTAEDVINKAVQREIDISTQLAKVSR